MGYRPGMASASAIGRLQGNELECLNLSDSKYWKIVMFIKNECFDSLPFNIGEEMAVSPP